MHVLFTTIPVVLTLSVASTAPAWSQGPRGGQGSPRYDTATEATFRGTVQEVKQVEAGGRRGPGTHVVLKTAEGAVEVHLGPRSFLDEQKLAVALGDAMEVVGSRVKVAGADVVIAREIRKGDQKLILRDESGIPRWSGGQNR
jgi:hypothetical protein